MLVYFEYEYYLRKAVQMTIIRRIVCAVLIWIVMPEVVFCADANKPNIIVFLVDDMGVMDTSVPFLTDAQGKPKKYPLNEYYRTPNMERLASLGVRFNNFCAMKCRRKKNLLPPIATPAYPTARFMPIYFVTMSCLMASA